MNLEDLHPGDELTGLTGPSGTSCRVLRVEPARAVLRSCYPTVSPYVGLVGHRHTAGKCSSLRGRDGADALSEGDMTHDGFLQAILAAPDADGPRLVFADALEENGETARSEFIKIQCRIAALNAKLVSAEDCGSADCPGCAERRQLQARERELFQQSSETRRWLGPALSLARAGDDWMSLLSWFRRGFVECVACLCADWLEYGPAICAEQPITHVTLSDRHPWNFAREGNQRDYFGWVRSQFTRRRFAEDNRAHALPDELARDDPDDWHRELFATVEEAHAALSAACLRWARG